MDRPHEYPITRWRRVHESLRSTTAMALGIADREWTIDDLIDQRWQRSRRRSRQIGGSVSR